MKGLRTHAAGLRLPALYLLAGTGLVVGYYMVDRPFGFAPWVPHLFFLIGVSFSSAVALLVGILLHRPVRRAAWLWIAAGQLVYFAADAVFYTYHDILNDLRYPAPSEALYLGNKALLAVGLFLLARQRLRDRGPLIDTLIVGSAAGLLIWIFLMGPYASGGDMALLVRLTSIAFPVMDLMVLLFAIRLFVNGVRTVSMYLLAASLACMLVSDFVYGWMQIHGLYETASFVNATWMASSLFLGASALHASMARSTASSESATGDLKTSRLLLLAGASLVAPATLLGERLEGATIDVYPVAAASVILFMLVVARLAQAGRKQKQALYRLERAEADKARLLARVVEVAEHERTRIAIGLHDGPIQELTALAFTLDLLVARIDQGDEEGTRASATHVREQIAGEIGSLRRLMSELRQPVLDERGLAAAVDDCASRVLGGEDVSWHTRTNVTGVRFAPELEAALYRIAHAAFINIRKHARARAVEIILYHAENGLRLSIEDDGLGFKPERNRHLGLVAMRELCESIGGHYEILSSPGHGTKIDVLVPTKSTTTRTESQPAPLAA